jgi:carboxymethylenebutenolidase
MRAAAPRRQPKTHIGAAHFLASARRMHAHMRRGDMTEATRLKSAIDGFELSALSARPAGKPIGGVVVLQEIFGLTAHIGESCALFADAGYAALAPGLFDRVEHGFHAEHDQDGIAKGVKAVMSSPWPQVVADVQAAIDALPKPCYVTGFCYGGAATWMAAAK